MVFYNKTVRLGENIFIFYNGGFKKVLDPIKDEDFSQIQGGRHLGAQEFLKTP